MNITKRAEAPERNFLIAFLEYTVPVHHTGPRRPSGQSNNLTGDIMKEGCFHVLGFPSRLYSR